VPIPEEINVHPVDPQGLKQEIYEVKRAVKVLK